MQYTLPPLVILDRDGVINLERDDFIKTPDEWVALPNSLPAMMRLYQRGIHLAVATNQSGIARGLYSEMDLDAIHNKMHHMFEALGGKISAVYACPHDDADQCDCRKPKPGLLWRIAKALQIPLQGIPAVGDRLRDLQAYASVGCQPILVLSGYGSETWRMAQQGEISLPDYTWVCADLDHAVTRILAEYTKD